MSCGLSESMLNNCRFRLLVGDSFMTCDEDYCTEYLEKELEVSRLSLFQHSAMTNHYNAPAESN